MHFRTHTGSIELPVFFASISSLKTLYSVCRYLQILAVGSYPTFLVSAYDLASLSRGEAETVRNLLSKAIAAGRTVLLDSGNYESYWLRDRTWTQDHFHSVLEQYPCSFAFSFDGDLAIDSSDTRTIIERLNADLKAAHGIPIVPIVHGNPSNLPRVVAEVVKGAGVSMVALPERELGVGIRERAGTLFRIRNRLNDERLKVAVHLLGTGNPLSIATYCQIGAQSFDGLEWCQTAVNASDGTLHHLSHSELFDRSICPNLDGLPEGVRALLVNLAFYKRWMDILRGRSDQDNGIYARSLKQARDLASEVKARYE